MILVIDNYDSFTYNIVQILGELTSEEIRVVRSDHISVAQIGAAAPSRIIISPGPGRPEDAGVSLAAVREFGEAIPILGVCLGHQVIGEAYGGRTVAAQNIVHGKVEPMQHDGNGVFRGIPSPAPFTRYHSLAIDRATLPESLEITATSRDGEIMGVRHRAYDVEGVQFHPESVGSDDGRRILANFLSYRRTALRVPALLNDLLDGERLSQERAEAFMEELTDGILTDAQIAAVLTAIQARRPTGAEIAGCAAVLRRKQRPFPATGEYLDTCGTGGDGLGTYNVSSMAALVAAAAGARVAKHGNRAVSSRSGSADFYDAIGVPVDLAPERAAALLEETGFAFLFAPMYHAAMRFAAPARRQLGVKTLMNLVGPLSNPAGAARQLIGVFDEAYMQTVAEAAIRLGVSSGMVVHGLDGQDELSVCAPSRCLTFTAGPTASGAPPSERVDSAQYDEFVLDPESYGLDLHPVEAMRGADAATNAAVARRVFAGETGRGDVGIADASVAALHDAVVLNAGAALHVARCVQTISDGVELAAAAIEDGRVAALIERLRHARG